MKGLLLIGWLLLFSFVLSAGIWLCAWWVQAEVAR